MRRVLVLVLALALTALPVAALPQGLADRLADADDIPVAEWIEMAMGRTLTYRIDGALWAFERYYPGSNRVTLQLYDGTCMDGTWDYDPPLYCFHWDGSGTACFRHARVDGEIVIIESQDGTDTPLLQTMTSVSDLPLQCGPAVTS